MTISPTPADPIIIGTVIPPVKTNPITIPPTSIAPKIPAKFNNNSRKF